MIRTFENAPLKATLGVQWEAQMQHERALDDLACYPRRMKADYQILAWQPILPQGTTEWIRDRIISSFNSGSDSSSSYYVAFVFLRFNNPSLAVCGQKENSQFTKNVWQ